MSMTSPGPPTASSAGVKLSTWPVASPRSRTVEGSGVRLATVILLEDLEEIAQRQVLLRRRALHELAAEPGADRLAVAAQNVPLDPDVNVDQRLAHFLEHVNVVLAH